MKPTARILFAFALVFTSFTAKSQLINPGFETWSADFAVPTAMNPNAGNGTTGWWDYNVYNNASVGNSPISVLRSDTAHGGSYSARIQTVVYTPTSWNIYKSLGIPYIGHNYSDTLGILFNGNLNEATATYKPGIPCTKKITSFSFFYQYAPKGVDTAECRVSIVKNRSLIAGGSFKTSVATGSTWNLATINMVYLDTLTPDSMYVLFSSSSLDRMPKPGSVFWIDDASITFPLGIQESSSTNDLSMFPNPTSGSFYVQRNNGHHPFENYQVSVYNALGETVYSSQLNSDKSEIDLSKEADGIYFVQLTSERGTTTKKLILNR
jgi:hypothetical protein